LTTTPSRAPRARARFDADVSALVLCNGCNEPARSTFIILLLGEPAIVIANRGTRNRVSNEHAGVFQCGTSLLALLTLSHLCRQPHSHQAALSACCMDPHAASFSQGLPRAVARPPPLLPSALATPTPNDSEPEADRAPWRMPLARTGRWLGKGEQKALAAYVLATVVLSPLVARVVPRAQGISAEEMPHMAVGGHDASYFVAAAISGVVAALGGGGPPQQRAEGASDRC
jgi:hypothetical protein